MKTGIMLVNHYVKSEKFSELYEMFLAASHKAGCSLGMVTNAEALFQLLSGDAERFLEDIDFVLFWDKDILLARLLEEKKVNIYNSAAAIEKCDDKGLTFIELQKHGIRLPKTFLAPKIFSDVGEDFTYFQKVGEELGFPLVIKENRGSFGFQVYLVEDWEDYRQTIRGLGNKPFLIQEFVASSQGRDVRIQVVGKEVAATVLRVNENDFRANATNGGRMHVYQPSGEEREMAVKVCEILELDFGGVDILFGREGEPVLCEVNSNAHLVNLYRCTGVNVAEEILGYILRDIEKRA